MTYYIYFTLVYKLNYIITYYLVGIIIITQIFIY